MTDTDRPVPADTIIPQLKLTLGDVSLWPVTPEDHQFLYWIASCDQNAYRWRFRGNVPSFENFQLALHTGVLTQFVVNSTELGRKVGHVIAYDADLSAGHVHMAAVLDPNFLYLHLGRDAMRILTRHLFRTWSFNYVYAEVPEYLVDLFRSSDLGELLPFEEVGRWPDYLFHDGRHYAMYQYAMSRAAFDAANPAIFG